MKPVTAITVYTSVDWKSRLAEKAAREAARILGVEYGITVDVIVVEVPVDSGEAEELGLPTVIVGSRVLSQGQIPFISDLVDAVFDEIGEKVGVTGVGLPLFPEVGVAEA